MKVRIGFGIGPWPFPTRHPAEFYRFADRCDEWGVDSLWFSDRLLGRGGVLEPVSAMSALAGRSRRLLLGTSAIALPLRNPVVLAKELATLDFLSGGRVVVAVGLGLESPAEVEAVGIQEGERARRTEEAVRALRLLWQGGPVDFHGEYYRFHGAVVDPAPYRPGGPPIWIGGRSGPALRRVALLGDGWLPSLVTPEEAGRGIRLIRDLAREAGRSIPEDHYGVYLPCALAGSVEEAEAMALPYLPRRREDVPPRDYCALGTPEQVRERLRAYLEQGVSKFVLRPACPPERFYEQAERIAREVIAPLQTPFLPEEEAERAQALPA